MRVLVLAPFAKEERVRLESTAGNYQFTFVNDYTPEQWEKMAPDAYKSAEIIIGEPELQDILPTRAPELRLVQMTWAGADRYTRSDSFPRGVQLTTASGAFGITISEHVIGAVLSLYRHFPEYRESQKERVWKKLGPDRTLYGSRVLILGMGNIGQETAKRLKAFDATVAGIRREQRLAPYFDEVHSVDELEEELAKADLVIGCMPDNDTSHGMMTEERFHKMKPDAFFVNVGRGGLTAPGALEKALEQKWIAGAALDVFPQEPLDTASLLWDRENVVITPHVAGNSFGHTKVTEQRIAEICAKNLENFAADRPLRNVMIFPDRAH